MIVLCDALCQGYVHEEANAGAVNEIINIENQNAVLLCDKKHYKNISKIIRQRTQFKKTIPYKKLLIPPKKIRQYKLDKYWDSYNVKKVLSFCNKNKIQQIVFLSITGQQLNILNKELEKRRNIRVLIVLHGIVEELRSDDEESLFKKSFTAAHKQIKFIILSPHIRNNLEKLGYKTVNLLTIDHPYIWNNSIKKHISTKHLKICIIGYIHNEKGRQYIESLMQKLAVIKGEFEMHILGSLETKVIDSRIKIFNRRFLRDELDELIPEYDFILAPYSFEGYYLKVSGVFFDAINYKTPIITFKNDFTEYYFKQLGEIGYMLDTVEKMDILIQNLIKNKRISEINKMIDNIENAKGKLSFSFINELTGTR